MVPTKRPTVSDKKEKKYKRTNYCSRGLLLFAGSLLNHLLLYDHLKNYKNYKKYGVPDILVQS